MVSTSLVMVLRSIYDKQNDSLNSISGDFLAAFMKKGAAMNDLTKKHRYRLLGDKRGIEVRVKVAQQLFDVRDPAPFHDRDLDDDFVDYIVSSARELPRSTPFKIVIYIESSETPELSKNSICEAIINFFKYQTERQRIELKSFINRAQVYLIIGLAILGIYLSLTKYFPASSTTNGSNLLREGLLIFGWVSIWRPIELILYDWYPFFEKLRFYRKLSTSEIDVQFSAVIPV